MKVVYANQAPPNSWTSAIFLAGPTPRYGTAIPSWRPDALKLLEESGYNGVVFVPETENGDWRHDYDDQIEWEELCLNLADIIIFWVPRELEHMPAFTTNDEWGFWKGRDPMKLVLGTPPDAPKVRYQRYYAEKLHVPLLDNLEDVCQTAIKRLGDTKDTLRTGGERAVPLHIWRTSSFQSWHSNLTRAGNRLEDARVEWVFRVGEKQETTFFWTLHVNIYITAENRHKTNEVVIGRPDISTTLLYERRTPLLDSRIVLVREFRSPASNTAGYVDELASGSSWDQSSDPLETAIEECAEEVGMEFERHRFAVHEQNQLAATALAHRSHLFSIELATKEMDRIAAEANTVRGVEADSERTWARVHTYREILDSDTVDWATLGMIAKVLHD